MQIAQGIKDAISEAIDQLLRYSEQRAAKGEGNAPLFYYNQFVVATCRQEAKFGTITTHTEKYFGSSGKWGGGDVVGTFRIPNLLPVRLSI